MKNIATTSFYDISVKDEIAILTVKEKVFDFITDVKLSDKLIDFIRQIDHNPDIKAFVYINEPESFSEENYDRFIRRVLNQEKPQRDCDPPSYAERNVRFREINILNTIIKTISGLQKLVVAGLNGNVVTPFFGASLVADFRYASENAVFSMIHNKYGLHPSGGLPFFLSSYLHHSKALEIQLTDRIDAQKAQGLGLITKILPAEDFTSQLIAEVKNFTGIKYCSLRDTKRLTNFYRKSLADYFEFEAELLNL